MKDELLKALEALAPEIIDRNKASLEFEKAASAVSCLLAEPQGLAVIEYLIDELGYGKKPLYLMDRFLGKSRIDHLVHHLYTANQPRELNVLLASYHQIWMNQKQDGGDARGLHEALKRLAGSEAVTSDSPVLKICLECYCDLDVASVRCEQCGESDLLTFHKLSLAQAARDTLKRGQYLEIYVKECFRESGIELIGWEFDEQGRKAYTGIHYQVGGEKIDIDVHCVSRPLALLLCEVKTSDKIVMNELRRVEELFDRLTKAVRELSGKEFPFLYLFVITGNFDQNIPFGAYRRRNWELLDRSSIPSLTDEFRRVQSEI